MSSGCVLDSCCDYAISRRPGGLALSARAVDLARLKRPAAVVDLGCGDGSCVAWLREGLGIQAVGIDRRQVSFLADLPLIQADAAALPIASCSLDAVLAQCSISLIPDPGRVFDECARVLKPGGRLIVTDLYARKADRTACLSTRELLEQQWVSAGFHTQLWEDHSMVLREFVARYLLEHDSLDELWGASPQPRLLSAKPGYFLMIATRQGASHRAL